MAPLMLSSADERRATIRVFIVDEDLNVLQDARPCGKLPAALQRTASRLLPTFDSPTMKSHALALSEGRIVRMIPVSGKTRTFAVAVERSPSRTLLRAAIAQYKFSAREVEVLLLALEGCTAAETARRLQLGISTINDHLNRLLAKSGTRNKTALIAKVLGWQES